MSKLLINSQPDRERLFMKRDLEGSFIDYLRVEKGLSQNTLIAYRNDLEKLSRFSQESGRDLLSVERDDLLAFVRHLHQAGMDPRSIGRVLVTVRGFYKYLILDGLLKRDPSANIETPKSWQSLPKFLVPEEVEKLLESPDLKTGEGIRDKAMLEVLYATGLRVSELVSLKVTDLNLDLGLLTTLGKGSKERSVPIGKSAISWVKRYLAVRLNLLSKQACN